MHEKRGSKKSTDEKIDVCMLSEIKVPGGEYNKVDYGKDRSQYFLTLGIRINATF